MIPTPAFLPTGGLLLEWSIHSDFFQLLATFVALNSLMYATLALLKVLPRGWALSRFNGRNRRGDNRSIYPESNPPPVAREAAVPLVDHLAAPPHPSRPLHASAATVSALIS